MNKKEDIFGVEDVLQVIDDINTSEIDFSEESSDDEYQLIADNDGYNDLLCNSVTSADENDEENTSTDGDDCIPLAQRVKSLADNETKKGVY